MCQQARHGRQEHKQATPIPLQDLTNLRWMLGKAVSGRKEGETGCNSSRPVQTSPSQVKVLAMQLPRAPQEEGTLETWTRDLPMIWPRGAQVHFAPRSRFRWGMEGGGFEGEGFAHGALCVSRLFRRMFLPAESDQNPRGTQSHWIPSKGRPPWGFASTAREHCSLPRLAAMCFSPLISTKFAGES